MELCATSNKFWEQSFWLTLFKNRPQKPKANLCQKKFNALLSDMNDMNLDIMIMKSTLPV